MNEPLAHLIIRPETSKGKMEGEGTPNLVTYDRSVSPKR